MALNGAANRELAGPGRLEEKGQIINVSKPTHKAKKPVIDGFVKAPPRSKASKPPLAKPAPQTHPKQDINTPAYGLHRRADKAHTLMRSALKKPSGGISARIERLSPGLSIQRELRAKSISKHDGVDHFGNPIKPSQAKQTVHGQVVRRPHRPASQPTSVPTAAVALPSMVTSASHQKLERLLDEALTQADAHKQALKYNAARHFWQKPGFLGKRAGLKLALVILLILGIGIYAAYREVPLVSVKVAGIKIHVDANVPAYVPDGYKLSKPAYLQGGAVVLSYNSSGNNRGFDLAQQKSNLSSTSLAQTVVAPGAPVQTSDVSGNTVYIYGANNDASWVNNRVLYTIKNHSKLTSDQIIKVVQSLD